MTPALAAAWVTWSKVACSPAPSPVVMSTSVPSDHGDDVGALGDGVLDAGDDPAQESGGLAGGAVASG